MRTIRSVGFAAACLAVFSAGGEAQTGLDMVISSNPELRALAAALLPDLAARSGMELKEPVRLEERSREELVRYLEAKLDAELPEAEARARVDAYALLGLVEPGLDLRAILLDLYTEQVAGFYDPDSTMLFVLDDQPAEELEALLVHELVHALQDQSVDLDALTAPELGNDRATAAQAAIEGHATLVMLEFMTEKMAGAPVDFGQIPDFAAQLRPALETISTEYPALASAPRVIREALLFPYVEGVGFVQSLWSGGERVTPFGEELPLSTEQVMGAPDAAPPLEIELAVTGATPVHEDVLGRFELGILLEDVVGGTSLSLAAGWEGDRYVLIEGGDGTRSLISVIVWESARIRDGFVEAVEGASARFGGETDIAALDVEGRPASVLKIGPTGDVSVSVTLARDR